MNDEKKTDTRDDIAGYLNVDAAGRLRLRIQLRIAEALERIASILEKATK